MGDVAGTREPGDGPAAKAEAGVLRLLRRIGARDGRLVHIEQFEARPGVAVPWPEWADETLVSGYGRRGVAHPWRHQVETAEALWAGRHTVLATSTGSGKSLAVWLPAITAVRQAAASASGRISQHRRRPTTLYLAPTKALAADQSDGLTALLSGAGITDVFTGTCDGDADAAQRAWVREHADVVLTNPDFLHHSLLPGHRRWQRLLRGLHYVVVDECHAYRGVFGAHVALVLRRLVRLARHYGADPTIVCLSATSADPRLTAARLCGLAVEDVVAVTGDTAPAGRRSILLWQPGLRGGEGRRTGGPAYGDAERGDADRPQRDSVPTETAWLMTELVRRRHRVLSFVRSRRGVESVADAVRESMPGGGLVAAYRGGYLPEERRELERSLRGGDLLGLVSTNALELGVDIAGLDAVLMAGWPGSRVSMWQQAGRSGRAGADGVAVLIAGENPLEAYFLEHPEAVFDEALEATVFDPRNPYVLAPHLCAAAAEVPITTAELAGFGLEGEELLAALERRGLLRRRPNGWYWEFSRPERPSDLVSLRGADAGTVTVVEEGTGTMLGTVDAARAHATVHPGAVYTHQGRHFLVTELSEDAALVTPADDIPWRTRALSSASVRILAARERVRWLDPHGRALDWGLGTVEVHRRVHAFQRLRAEDRELIDTRPLHLGESRMETAAVWWSVQPEILEEIDPARLGSALHALEHLGVAMLPLLATCDAHDLGGDAAVDHPDTEQPTMLVYDAHAGGAGFAERGFGRARDWLTAMHEAAGSCPCAEGCPRCVQSPSCGRWNADLDKAAAVEVLAALLRCEWRGSV